MSRLFRLIILSIVLLAGCGIAAAPQPTRPPLRVAWVLWPGWYPIAIAQERGFFQKHGVQVDSQLYERYSDIPVDFAAGKLDGGVSGLYDILPLPNIQDARVVLVTDNSNGAEGLVAIPTVRTPAELAGKRIGMIPGSIGEFFVRTLLQKHGLAINDVTVVLMDPEHVPSQLPSAIDVGYTWEPHLSQAIASQNHILASTADIPGLIPDVVFFHHRVINDRPDDVRAFVAAWLEAVTYWQQNPAEGNAIIARATGLKVEEVSAEGARLFTLDDNLRAFTPGNDATSLYYTGQVQLDFLKTTGGIRTNPNIQQLLDPTFLKTP